MAEKETGMRTELWWERYKNDENENEVKKNKFRFKWKSDENQITHIKRLLRNYKT